jgi:hydroxymethylbilane synthase
MIRLATRSSAQATAQTVAVADALRAAHPGLVVEVVFVETLGDLLADAPLHSIGGQGVFVKEVQRAVLAGHADAAVHSAKDLPSTASEGLAIAAFTERRDARDALVGCTLAGLAHGATVASGSVRRRAQLTAVRPDLCFAELRGNIQTRLTKIPAGGAIVMAMAALQILGLTDRIAEVLDAGAFVPAPGQGCVAIECRTDELSTIDLLGAIDHGPTRHGVEAERAFLAELGSGCSLPVGAHAADGRIAGFLADPPVARFATRAVELPVDGLGAVAAASALARDLAATIRGAA